MPIFKIHRHDRPERKSVMATGMVELMQTAKIKLQLADEEYKIFLEDYTEIDEDEILMAMAGNSKEHLILTFVPAGIPWNAEALQFKPSSSPTACTSSAVDSTTSMSSNQRLTHMQNILNAVNPLVKTNLEEKAPFNYRNRKSFVHTVVDYLMSHQKYKSRGNVQQISDEFCSNYPDTFNIVIANNPPVCGADALRQEIYEALNYASTVSKKGSTFSKSLDEDGDDNVDLKRRAQDEYGCVEYLPVLPPSVTVKHLEAQKMALEESFNISNGAVTDEVVQQMDETYYLQRLNIIKLRDVSEFFKQWPFFSNYKILLTHAKKLLGKELDVIWNNSLLIFAKPLNIYFKNNEISIEFTKRRKLEKPDKTKSSNDPSTSNNNETVNNGSTNRNRSIRDAIKKAKSYSSILNNDIPYHEIIFGFIVSHMKEKLDLLYIFVNENLEEADIMNQVPVLSPLLVIRGKELHDPKNIYDVVLEKKIAIRATSFTDGILLLFACYYVFGFLYPKEIEISLETIQRLFLTICPEKGNKREGKRRRATIVPPKITKLMMNLKPFMNSEN